MQKPDVPQSFELTGVTLKTGEHSHPFPDNAIRGELSTFIDSPPLSRRSENLQSTPSVFDGFSEVKQTTGQQVFFSKTRSSSFPKEGRQSKKWTENPLSEHRFSIESTPLACSIPLPSGASIPNMIELKVPQNSGLNWEFHEGTGNAQQNLQFLYSEADYSALPVKPPLSVTELSSHNNLDSDLNKPRYSSSGCNSYRLQQVDDWQDDKAHAAKAFLNEWGRDEENLSADDSIKERKASRVDVDYRRTRKTFSSSDIVSPPRKYPRISILYSLIMFLLAVISLSFLVIFSRERELVDFRKSGPKQVENINRRISPLNLLKEKDAISGIIDFSQKSLDEED